MSKAILFEQYPIRHAISSLVAVMLAGMGVALFSFSNTYWMIFSAVVVCMVTKGAPLRQALIYIAIMMISIILASVIKHQGNVWVSSITLVAIYGVVAGVLTTNRPIPYKDYFTMMLFFITFGAELLMPHVSDHPIYAQVLDVWMGGLIGVMTSALVLPIRVVDDFYDGLSMVLIQLSACMHVMAEYYEGKKTNVEVESQLNTLHAVMLSRTGMYPEWVYDVGFNRLLRAGFRYYLIVIDRVIEMLSAIYVLLMRSRGNEFIERNAALISKIMSQNETLIGLVIRFIDEKKYIDSEFKYLTDVQFLEDALQTSIPASLDVLDLTPQFMVATALVRNIRDLRELLLKLLMALPERK